MSRLPVLEQALIAAAARLDARDEPLVAAAPERGGLRARWRRMSRRGHVAGLLVGTVVLGGVATGSAQVAGLHPFRSLQRFEQHEPGLRPIAAAHAVSQMRAPVGAARDWLVRGYLARNGHLCTTGGVANAVGASALTCRSTDEVAQALVDPEYPGSAVVDVFPAVGTQDRPEQVVVFGVVIDGSLPPLVKHGGRTTRAALGRGIIRMRVNRATLGLSAAGRRFVQHLPATLDLRMFAVQVAAPTGLTHGVYAGAISEPRSGNNPVVVVRRWQDYRHDARVRAADDAQRRRGRLLDRVPLPVARVSDALRRVEPAFDRPRTAADVVPAHLVDRTLVASHARRQASRRLHPVGVSDLGPMWLLPGRMNVGLSQTKDALCLAGPKAIQGCVPLIHGAFPGLQAVICSPTLDPQQRLLYGLVPPGVTHARLTFDHGASPQTIAVRDVFAVAVQRTAPLIRTVTWLGAGRPRTVTSSFPGNTAPDQCATNKATGLRVLRRVVDGRGGDTEIVTRRP